MVTTASGSSSNLTHVDRPLEGAMRSSLSRHTVPHDPLGLGLHPVHHSRAAYSTRPAALGGTCLHYLNCRCCWRGRSSAGS